MGFSQVSDGGSFLGDGQSSGAQQVFGIGPIYDPEARRMVWRVLVVCMFMMSMMTITHLCVWFAQPVHLNASKELMQNCATWTLAALAVCCMYRGIKENNSAWVTCFSGIMGVCICWNICWYLAFTGSMWVVETKVNHCLKVHEPGHEDSPTCHQILETLKPLAQAAETGTSLGLICGFPMCVAQGLLCFQTWRLASRMDEEPVVVLGRPPATQLTSMRPQTGAGREMRHL